MVFVSAEVVPQAVELSPPELVPGDVPEALVSVDELPGTVTVSVLVDLMVVVESVSEQPYGLVQDGPVGVADVPGTSEDWVLLVVDVVSVPVPYEYDVSILAVEDDTGSSDESVLPGVVSEVSENDVSEQPYGLVQGGAVVLALAEDDVPGSSDDLVVAEVDVVSVPGPYEEVLSLRVEDVPGYSVD